jgi:hypothetical protein
MFAHAKFVESKPVKLAHQIQVLPDQLGGVLADRMMRR